MNGRINVAKAPGFMVSRRPPNPVRKARPAQILARYSPLGKTPHKATVIRDGAMSTAGALIDMAAECGGATARNGQQDFDMRPADPLAVAPEESNSRGADQVGQLQERPTHLCLRL